MLVFVLGVDGLHLTACGKTTFLFVLSFVSAEGGGSVEEGGLAGVNTTRVGGVVRWSDVSGVLSFGRGPFFFVLHTIWIFLKSIQFFLFMTYSIYDLLTCDLRTGSAVT